jgi:hypothetical protein
VGEATEEEGGGGAATATETEGDADVDETTKREEVLETNGLPTG